jgi:hypothetical protein
MGIPRRRGVSRPTALDLRARRDPLHIKRAEDHRMLRVTSRISHQYCRRVCGKPHQDLKNVRFEIRRATFRKAT